jgi:hypothetical protein
MSPQFLSRTPSREDSDIFRLLLGIMDSARAPYCAMGGIAIDAHVAQSTSMDIDIVISAANSVALCMKAAEKGLKMERIDRQIYLTTPKSALRFQLRTDAPCQEFILRAGLKKVLGCDVRLARVEDILADKVRSAQDEFRDKTKRLQDIADISRIVKKHRELMQTLPDAVRKQVR